MVKILVILMEILLIGGYNDKVEKNKELGLDLATDMKKMQMQYNMASGRK